MVQRGGGSRRRCRRLPHPGRPAQQLVVEGSIGIGCLLLRIPSVDHLRLLPDLGWERKSTEIGLASYGGCHNTCELGSAVCNFMAACSLGTALINKL